MTRRALAAAVLLASTGCDVFHSTSWVSLCEKHPSACVAGGAGGADASGGAGSAPIEVGEAGGGSPPACDAADEHLHEATGHCYRPSGESTADWPTARADCLAWGGDLATITSLLEQQFVRGFQTDGWIGATDVDEEGTFEWANGEPFSFTGWYHDEPNSAGDEDCVHMMSPASGNAWNDLECATAKRWLCERGP